MSSMNLNVSSAFLATRKARKGHWWLPSNGMEVFDNGKWHWRCARCKFFNLSYTNYLKYYRVWLAQMNLFKNQVLEARLGFIVIPQQRR